MPVTMKREGRKERRLTGELPEPLGSGAVLVEELARSGVLAEAASRVRIARKVGYSAIDALVYLVYFFAGGPHLGGLRGFCEMYREWVEVLGALAGRERLMSSSALSRLLSAVDPDALAEGARWWLLEATGGLALLQNPAVLTRDAGGEGWHVFDYDPSREAYRQRALPSGALHPPALRRMTSAAAPGRAGRKRGEVVSTEGLLQHHGSGLWLDATVEVGNGDAREQFESALAAVVRTCTALNSPLNRALVRTDGEFSGVPSLSAAKAAGVAYLTRMCRYDVLNLPTVRERLNAARWERVPDAGSGPVRYAADLGEIALPPGRTTLRKDGSRYEPVIVRVVVSRFTPQNAEEYGAGVLIGDEVFECFACLGLPATRWSASAVVAAFYGRISQENRFAQLDRELQADTRWARTPGGQLLALLALLFVWNVRIVQGVHIHAPLPPRQLPPPVNPEDAPLLPRLPAPSMAEPNASPAALERPASDSPANEPAAQHTSPSVGEDSATDAGGLRELLEAAGLPALVARRAGWVWDGAALAVRTADGRELRLASVERKRTSVGLRFRDASRGPPSARRATFTMPVATAAAVQQAWRERDRPRRDPARTAAYAGTDGPVDPSTWLARLASDDTPSPGPPDWPTFLPAAARQAAVRAAAAVRVFVDVRIVEPDRDPGHPLAARSRPAVRHQRRDHAERLARYAASPETRASLTTRARPNGPRERTRPLPT